MIDKSSPELFATRLTPGTPGSGRLFDEQLVPANDAPVTCLGKTFANDTERRAYFTEEIRKRLADPDFREIEGFPRGISKSTALSVWSVRSTFPLFGWKSG